MGGMAIVTLEEQEVVKDRIQQNKSHSQQPSTGPASRAACGSSTSIPYIDCSDVDSENDLRRGHLTRSRSQTNDNYECETPTSIYFTHREESSKYHRYRNSPTSAKAPSHIVEEFIDDDLADVSFYTGGSPRMPRHSSLIDEMFSAPDSRSPLASPLSPSGRGSSPIKAGSKGCITENGYGNRGRNLVEDGYAYPCHDYDKYSPALQRPYFQKLQNVRNRSETDPFILSQGASTPVHESRTEKNCKGRLAKIVGVQGKIMENGVSSPGQARHSPVMQSLYTRGMVEHMGSVQMVDGSTSSGSESSDSDSEMVSPFTHPLVFGNPVVLNSTQMPRNKYSFGSLHLEEDAEEEDASVNLSDEDGVNVFSC